MSELLRMIAPVSMQPVKAAVEDVPKPAKRGENGLANEEVEELYQQYVHVVRRVGCRVFRSTRQCDELVQDVFFKLMTHGAAIRDVDSKHAYIARVAYRCAVDILQKSGSSGGKSTPAAPDLDADCPAPGLDLTHLVLSRQSFERLWNRLDPLQRVILLLWLAEKTQGEIADYTSLARQTVNGKLQAIAVMARDLEKEGEA
jgi:RNA polymerase sigma factor (sigma-70 family)